MQSVTLCISLVGSLFFYPMKPCYIVMSEEKKEGCPMVLKRYINNSSITASAIVLYAFSFGCRWSPES